MAARPAFRFSPQRSMRRSERSSPLRDAARTPRNRATARFRAMLEMLEGSSGWYWETDGEHRFTYVSDRLIELTGVPRDRWLGASRIELLRQAVFPEEVAGHIEDLFAHRPFAEVAYWIDRPTGRRRYSMTGQPAQDAEGRFLGYRGVGRDTTAAVLFDQAAEFAAMRALFDAVPTGLGVLDRDLRFRYVNQSLAETNGPSIAGHLGRFAFDIVPALRQTAEPLLRHVLETGEAVANIELSGETPAQPGVTRQWLEQICPLRGADGAMLGIGVIVEEVTQRRRAEAHQKLLAGEFNHRINNILGLVQMVARQSLPGAEGIEAFEARLGALARAQRQLTGDRLDAAPLRKVIAAALEPHCTKHESTMVRAPELELSAEGAQGLSMVLHELCTNAAKYGALSRPGGLIEIDGEIVAGKAPRLRLVWRESGGPAVAPPRRKGFGARLIEGTIGYQFRGEAHLDFRADGLHATLLMPLRRIAAR